MMKALQWKKTRAGLVAAAALVGLFAAGGQYALGQDTRINKIGYTDEFFLDDCDFSDTGSNRFFILEPNYQLVLKGEEDGEEIELVITVLEDTKLVDGIKTRVVEERESEGGELVEVSRNFFAVCEQTNSVFYFGEEVDDYEDGEIVGHEGEWLAGKDGAKAGLMMPGLVLINSKYQQETAPGVAMDRARIVSMDESIKTPAGDFENVLKIRETTPLEPDAIEYKFYVAGIGLIQDSDLRLVDHGFAD
jgi:hypothetical protein